ncbi:sensor histidine kinase [Microbacterium sp. NPDC089189]|uniref:sensor histidine kinase n=1 Tax=Microbacterium sp. NPDC089189 TaxID=3154972 RepID=UPI0034130E10
MSEPRAGEPAAVSAKGWGVSLAAVGVVCVVTCAAWAIPDGGPWAPVGLTAAVIAAYAAAFVLFIRRVAAGSVPAVVSVAVTILLVAGLTAVVPSNATFQFWAYPVVWALLPTLRTALPATFVLSAAVFVGFAASTGSEDGWWITALLTQIVSFAVNVVMGLWISSVYRYGVERGRLLAELTAAQHELAALHRDAGTTAERARISRELHDTIAQSLTAAVLLVQRARHRRDEGTLDDAALALVEESVRAALTETRVLVAGSAPLELDGGGIEQALGTLADRFRREAGVAVDVSVRLSHPLDRETEVALLRSAQEGFGNIRKHAAASRVRVDLSEDGTDAVLRVRDDGRGFDPDAVAAGFGLAGLRDRLALLGGSLEIDGSADAVELRARIPNGGSA